MNWSSEDNKNQRGKINRIYVSSTESYELNYFVADYLKTSEFNETGSNAKSLNMPLMNIRATH